MRSRSPCFGILSPLELQARSARHSAVSRPYCPVEAPNRPASLLDLQHRYIPKQVRIEPDKMRPQALASGGVNVPFQYE